MAPVLILADPRHVSSPHLLTPFSITRYFESPNHAPAVTIRYSTWLPPSPGSSPHSMRDAVYCCQLAFEYDVSNGVVLHLLVFSVRVRYIVSEIAPTHKHVVSQMVFLCVVDSAAEGVAPQSLRTDGYGKCSIQASILRSSLGERTRPLNNEYCKSLAIISLWR